MPPRYVLQWDLGEVRVSVQYNLQTVTCTEYATLAKRFGLSPVTVEHFKMLLTFVLYPEVQTRHVSFIQFFIKCFPPINYKSQWSDLKYEEQKSILLE